MPASLSPKQYEMLLAVVAAGQCGRQERSGYRSAWIVRTRTVGGADLVRPFSQNTGDVLLSRGFIQPDPAEHEIRNAAGTLILRRYVPTALGRGVVARARSTYGRK